MTAATPRAARPQVIALVLVLAVVLDVASALILGTAADPTRFITLIWPHQHFHLGESTLDVLVLGVLRALCRVCVCVCACSSVVERRS